MRQVHNFFDPKRSELVAVVGIVGHWPKATRLSPTLTLLRADRRELGFNGVLHGIILSGPRFRACRSRLISRTAGGCSLKSLTSCELVTWS